MIIKEMFSKEIDRDIKGVIKIGQSDEENIRQELEEYVVTRELTKHFTDFFSSYTRGITGYTDKMGVWISGFFGSGKSHFLKILSYLLANKEVDGKRAIDYFTEGNKIVDHVVLTNMRLAASTPTDVVLFNIDSKSDVVGNKAKDAIVSVFLKVFNEMQGFSGSNPYLADLERQLTRDGLYNDFKATFKAVHGAAWEASRHKFGFIQDTVVETLVSIGFMSEAAARNWCEKTVNPYAISIADFVRLVKEYMDRQTPNHHLVFLVDEMGQYIGEDSNLMLNLQTLTEDLGVACKGKVWIVVTSQQDIDSVTKVKGNDFSKIQGRFDTRLSLSSANADEVIKKRILAKNSTAEQTLRLIYEQNATIIKNLITFHDRVEKKLYSDAGDFSAVYPFIPYQFNLLGDVLNSIRTHGASGKHLSEGERSMLALFQESAKTIMDKSVGPLVPFNVFYDALYNFLDHSHKVVIDRAWSNSHINPDEDEDCFAVNVLKVLFMIKYIKQIEANLENITTLMIPDINADRIALRGEVERALDVLVRQKFVEREGDLYIFLTNEEQEISREIDNMPVEMNVVIKKVAELIFTGIYKESRYRYPAHNGRYGFAFNQLVDGSLYGRNQSNDVSVHVLTPSASVSTEEVSLRMMSGEGREVLVVLPNDASFLNELRSALKIEAYLRRESMASNMAQRFEKIREAKRSELQRRNSSGQVSLAEALRAADIYVNGDKLEASAKDVAARINEALGKLVSTVYHKLPYIDTAMNEADIRSLFEPSAQQKLDVSGATNANVHALADVLGFIANNSANHVKTSVKTLMDRFMRAPYGFVEADVEWLVAKLFKDGDIALTLNGESITPLNRTPDELARYLTRKEFVDKLMTERREKASEHQKRIVREIMKALFDTTSIHDDDDAIMTSFQSYARNLLHELDRLENMYHNKPLPGKDVVATGKRLLREALQLYAPTEFFKKVPANRDCYLDFADDYEPLKAFFAGEQKVLFETALELMAIYDDSKSYIVNRELEDIVREIKSILSMGLPYSAIPSLPILIKNFRNTYSRLLADMAEPILDIIEAARKRVLEELDTKVYVDKYRAVYNERFAEIKHKARSCNNVATLQSTRLEADAMKVRLLNEMGLLDAQRAKRVADNGPAPDPVVRKTISIKTVTPQISWQIEKPEDLEGYIVTLKERILRELKENTILNIEF